MQSADRRGARAVQHAPNVILVANPPPKERVMKRMGAKACVLFIVLTVVAIPAVAALAAALDPNNPTGTSGLIMIDKRGELVRFFDPATLKEVSTLKLEAPPHELAISPDHKTAYVPLYGDGVYGNNPNPGHKIVAIDLATRTVRSTI